MEKKTGNSIRSWSAHERPRERLLAKGPQALSDAELIAILVGNGCVGMSALDLAHSLLNETGGLPALGKWSPARLAGRRGIGTAKAARILAACELGRRREGGSRETRLSLHSPEAAARLINSLILDRAQECVLILLLDSRHRLLSEVQVGLGGLESAGVQPRDVLRPALEQSAAAVILAHNHPSGDPQPSRADVEWTERLQAATDALGIRLLDHIIVGEGAFYSLAEKGHFQKSRYKESQSQTGFRGTHRRDDGVRRAE